jgi:hypothetical protein
MAKHTASAPNRRQPKPRQPKPRPPKARPPKARRPKAAQPTNADHLNALRLWLLGGHRLFDSLPSHGNRSWKPADLVWLALCWAWSPLRCLTAAFTDAANDCVHMLGASPLGTYQGFMNALVRWTGQLLPPLQATLHQLMQKIGGRFWRIDGWVPLAFDGSRSSAPRSRSNEEALCAPRYGKGQTAKYRRKKTKGLRRRRVARHKQRAQEPQAWITLLWHMGLQQPWDWRLGPSNSSERAHVMEMLAGTFPADTLFCGDAGFVGYPLWSLITRRGHDFVVRVGANASLLTEQADWQWTGEGKAKRVLCWPKGASKQGLPPLRLRLMQVQLGRAKVWLLTSVLEPERLTLAQAKRLYRMRWGLEVEFRGLKQTLERSKLCSRNAARLLAELDWSILAMAVAELFALKEQLSKRAARRAGRRQAGKERQQGAPDPSRRSLAKTMRALRGSLRALGSAPAEGRDLASQLREAVTDGYERKKGKASRSRAPNPDKKPLGDPKLRPLSREEKRKLQQVQEKAAA